MRELGLLIFFLFIGESTFSFAFSSNITRNIHHHCDTTSQVFTIPRVQMMVRVRRESRNQGNTPTTNVTQMEKRTKNPINQ